MITSALVAMVVMAMFQYSTILLVLLCSCVPPGIVVVVGKVDHKRGVQEEKGVLENFVVDGDLGHWERRRVYRSSFSSSSSSLSSSLSSLSFSEQKEELLRERAKYNNIKKKNNIFLGPSSSSSSSHSSFSDGKKKAKAKDNNVFLRPVALPKYPKCATTKKGLVVLDKYFTYSSGLMACCEMNLYPAGITSLNFVEASDVAFSCSGPGTGTWIRSWNRDNYGGGDTCLSFNTAWSKGGGSINPAATCQEGKKVMCQVEPAPEEPFFCSQFTTTTTSRSTSCTSTSTSSSTSTSTSTSTYSTFTSTATDTSTDTSSSTSTDTSSSTATDTSSSTATDTSSSTATDTSTSDTSTSSTSSSSSSSNSFISTHVMTATQFTTLTVTSTSTTSTITTGTAYTTQTISPNQ